MVQTSYAQDFADLTLFITGPTYVRREILEAGLLPVFGHRDSEAKKRISPSLDNLRQIARVGDSYHALLIPGTGTSAMETSLRSLVGEEDRLLCVSIGAFGDLYHEIAMYNGKRPEKLSFEPGKAVDLGELERKVREYHPTVVAVTHNETSTGVTNDIVSIGKIAKEEGALYLVDGVSIFGGAHSHIERAGVDMYSTSTQKCLGLPPGFGIAFVSERAILKAGKVPEKGYTTNLLEHITYAENGQTLTTTPTQLANQLFVQTEYIVHHEGIENRFLRHRQMRNRTLEWIATLPDGFSLFPDQRDASPSVTTIRVPSDFDRAALKKSMKESEGHKYLFDPGYKKLSVPTIRIGHMGDITMEMLEEYLEKLWHEIYRVRG